jgi:hypothetical protein
MPIWANGLEKACVASGENPSAQGVDCVCCTTPGMLFGRPLSTVWSLLWSCQ